MNRFRVTRTAAALLALLLPATSRAAFSPAPPPTRAGTVVDTLHGVAIADPYRWLEDQQAPETRAWIAAQQQYEHGVMAGVPGREALRARYGELLRTESATRPFERGGRYFFTKRRPDQDLYVLYVRDGRTGADRVVVDPHPMSRDHSYSVGWEDASDDGRLAAYTIRHGGEDETIIHVLDMTRGTVVDSLPKRRYFSMAFVDGGRAAVYGAQTADGPRVYRHTWGSGDADPVVFGAGYGHTDIIGVSATPASPWLVYTVFHGASGDNNEIWLQNTATHAAPWALVKDVHASFYADVAGDTAVLRTSWNAPNGRLLRVDLAHPEPAAWREIVPERPDATVDAFTLAGGRVIVQYLHDVASSLEAFDLSGHPLQRYAMPMAGSIRGLSGRAGSGEVFYSYTSYLVPERIERLDVARGTRGVWWQPKLPFDPSRFVLEQAWVPSKDGTKIPMWLVHRKGLPADGARPTYLTGYGGFDLSETPSFSATCAIWVEHGGVFAEPALRGGGEFGEKWHEAGMLEKKQNVFDDFAAAAQWLIDRHWTSPAKLAIEGASNGGLLVGAAMTQHPELFQAVVCAVPLLDMLRYQNFLVARYWTPEYGSAEDPRQFPFIDAYSPYQHVKPGTNYPAVLFVSGDSDTRVAPLHARKMTALMQASTGGDRPVLLHYDSTSGHSAGKPVGKQIEDSTDTLQFLFWQLGVDAAAKSATAVP